MHVKLPAFDDTFGLIPAIDGLGLWCFQYFGTGIKHINLTTLQADITWTWNVPSGGNIATMEDGTPVAWQDSNSVVWICDDKFSTGATLYGIDGTNPTFTIVASIPLSTISEGLEARWSWFDNNVGADLAAIISNGFNQQGAVYNLDTHALVGNLKPLNATNYPEIGAHAAGYRGRSIFMDENGFVWWMFSPNNFKEALFVIWDPSAGATGGILNTTYRFWASGDILLSTSPKFAAYNTDSGILIAGNSNDWTGDLTAVWFPNPPNFSQWANHADDLTFFYSGTFDAPQSALGWPSNPFGAFGPEIVIPGDVPDAGATQRGGVIRVISPYTLSEGYSLNVTAAIKADPVLSTFLPPPDNDFERGMVTPPFGNIVWFRDLRLVAVTYEYIGSPVFLLDVQELTTSTLLQITPNPVTQGNIATMTATVTPESIPTPPDLDYNFPTSGDWPLPASDWQLLNGVDTGVWQSANHVRFFADIGGNSSGSWITTQWYQSDAASVKIWNVNAGGGGNQANLAINLRDNGYDFYQMALTWNGSTPGSVDVVLATSQYDNTTTIPWAAGDVFSIELTDNVDESVTVVIKQNGTQVDTYTDFKTRHLLGSVAFSPGGTLSAGAYFDAGSLHFSSATLTSSTPTGGVMFMDNNVQLGGDAILDNTGVASLQVNSLSIGSHPITALYKAPGIIMNPAFFNVAVDGDYPTDITGVNTHFVQNVTTAELVGDTAVSAVSVTVHSPTSCTATFTIDALDQFNLNQTNGPNYRLRVITGNEVVYSLQLMGIIVSVG